MISIGLFSKLFIILSLHAFKLVSSLDLTILHTNDIHCRYTEINKYGQRCNKPLESCFGGIPRLSKLIGSIRKRQKNVILLDGGDVQTGSLWYLTYRGNASAHFLRQLKYDAMVPGNHDFDGGSKQTFQYFTKMSNNNQTTKIIASNIETSSTQWDMIEKFRIKSLSDGTQLGICGYIIAATKQFSHPPRDFEFSDEVESVRRCAKGLSEQGVKIIIALGHAGIDMDLKIAREVEEVDIVVGGHTNTFLYTGTSPSTEIPYGPYPFIVQTNNKTKAVVQAFTFGKYLGYLNATFDDKGGLVAWSGNPKLLDESHPKDDKLEKEIQNWGQSVDKLAKEHVGIANSSLNQSDCTVGECNFGNLLTDAMIDSVHQNKSGPHILALVTANTMKHSILQGRINFGALFGSLPYQNELILVTIKGRYIRKMMEISASNWKRGKFLQVSGLSVTYKIKDSKSAEITQLFTQRHGDRPQKVLDDDAVYQAVVTSYVFMYGTYKVLRENAIQAENLGYKEIDAVVEYIRKINHINIVKDGRIKVKEDSSRTTNGGTILTTNGHGYLFLYFFFS